MAHKTKKPLFPDEHNAPETAENTPPVSLRQTVLDTCLGVCRDPLSKPGERVQAARTLAEMAGLLGKVQTGALDTGETRQSEMAPEDIDRAIARLSGTGSGAK